MSELKPCPCGEIPESLCTNSGSESATPKWAYVSGNCCNMWEVEYRTGYADITTDAGMQIAIVAWNAAPRGKPATGADKE